MAQTVLLCDDDRHSCEHLRQGLADEGYRCLEAFNPQQAIESFDREKPDAIIIALPLTGGPGIELIDRVKASSPYTVVLAVGSKASERRAVQALKLGADDYLARPVSKEIISQILRKNLGRAAHDRKLALSENGESQQADHLAERIFAEAPAALLLIDRSMTITVANRAASKVLGLHRDEIIGAHFNRFVSDRVRDEFFELVRSQSKLPKGFDGEIHLQRGDGEWFPAKFRAVDRPEKDHLLLFVEDMTTQKSIEKRLYESKKLASLGHVVEGVAHEVRNPLISIGGFVRKLHREFDASSNEQKYTSIILSEVERLERMVSDIEEYVKFARARSPGFARVDALETISSATAKALEAQTPGNAVKVRFEHPQTPLTVYGDGEMLFNLFFSLIQNACESMPCGGEVTISLDESAGWINAVIKDSGAGIAPCDMEEIFNPFFTSKTNGAGLGLAKAFMIVEDHEGKIHFESELGKGTVCTVSLPADRRRILKRTGI